MCDALRHWGLGWGGPFTRPPEFCSAEQHRHAPKVCWLFHGSSDPFVAMGRLLHLQTAFEKGNKLFITLAVATASTDATAAEVLLLPSSIFRS
ncbi:hypothetical protein HDV63DRAFT_37912 [Trichoderma sp. SZMC 28014]